MSESLSPFTRTEDGKILLDIHWTPDQGVGVVNTIVCCEDPIRVDCGCGDCDAGAAGDMCGNCGELWLTP